MMIYWDGLKNWICHSSTYAAIILSNEEWDYLDKIKNFFIVPFSETWLVFWSDKRYVQIKLLELHSYLKEGQMLVFESLIYKKVEEVDLRILQICKDLFDLFVGVLNIYTKYLNHFFYFKLNNWGAPATLVLTFFAYLKWGNVYG